MANPVILTVDDDPVVSRAVARDIRRRYGDRYRVLRASSGPEALDALREVKLRGEQVALLLADHRMPEMTGVEFLEAAMDIFPAARRVLLTAYADTDAAIEAINVVDLDHYLLKPWHPPEEKLYPVVDGLLEAWAVSPDAATVEIRVVGHRWSAPSFKVRDFLARNLVPYRWLLSDDPEGARLLDAAGATEADVPLVVTPEGKALVAPSEAELAALAGLTVVPACDFYDLVVIGGGPAGLGSAVYGASEGLRTVLVERRATGGQAGQSSRIENYLGFPDGVSGAQLTDRARRQAVKFGAELLSAREVVGLSEAGGARLLRFGDGTEIAAHTVVLATGVSYRVLDAPGLADFTGRGVFYGAAATEAPSCVEQDVYIVGGANSAGQAAVHFSRYAARVHLLIRGADLTASMSRYLIDQLERIDKITVHPHTAVVGGGGGGPPGTTHPLRHPHRGGPLGRHLVAVHLHRCGAPHRLAGRGAGPRRAWLHRDRPGPPRRGAATGRLVAVARPVPPGDQRSGRVRRRGRAGRVGQAGRLSRRRGRDGGVVGAPLPGGPVSARSEPVLRAKESQ